MKQLFFYLSIIALFFVGDRLAGHLLGQQVAASQFRYSRLYNGQAGAETLLLGNSRGLAFYQPYLEQTTGKRCFNLSYNGLPMDAAQALVADYLDRYAAPKTLLIDITMCDRENDQLLAGFLTYAQQSERLSGLIRQKMPKMWWGGQVSALMCLNNEVFQRALYYRQQSDDNWLLDRVISPDLAQSVSKQSYTVDVQPYLLEQLQRTVAAAQAKGVKVQLVIGPYFPGFQVKNLGLLKQLVEQKTGLVVHDYSGTLSDPTLFGDFMHPNKRGSAAYIDFLRRDGIID